MSADNGIYMLKTLGPEFRVKELSAVDNLEWDDTIENEHGEVTGGYSNDPDIHIKNAREMWYKCKVFNDENKAYNYALKLLDDNPYTEYGLCRIDIDRKF